MFDPTWIQAITGLTVAVGGSIGVIREVKGAKARGADDRTIQLHRDLTTGEIGAVRDRFTELMYRTGEKIESGRCYRPTFLDLLHPRYSGEGNGRLCRYPRSMHAPEESVPMQDLYKILWTFERINASLESKRLDAKLTLDLIGSHAVWWNQLLARISESDTMHRKSLNRFATWALSQSPTLKTTYESEFVN